jgi:hypothetical protein
VLRNAGAALEAIALAQRSPAAERRIKALRKFLRMARRVFRFTEDDLENCGLKKDADWEWLRTYMIREGLLAKSIQQPRRGPNSEMLQLMIPPDVLLAGETGASSDPRIIGLWSSLESL